MKRTTSISLLFLVLLALAGSTLTNCTRTDYGDWAQQKAPLMTKWSADAMPGKAWTEYPRPQMERKNWKNLNGLWDYAITPVESQKPETWAGKILVPYPVESALSGVMKTLAEGEKLWYHRELKSPVRMKTERVLIHFEAVDWLTRVYIDDQLVGEHQGGYDPFSFDLTDYLKSGENHDLFVEVLDPTTRGYQPVGKQTHDPRGIWYTPSSGIWQTVWLEKVPDTYINDYRVIPDIDTEEVTVRVLATNYKPGDDVEVKVLGSGQLINTEKGDAEENIRISIANPRLWELDDPYLYDLEISIVRDSKVVDRVKGYFGMRKTSLGKDENGITRLMFNNRFLFQNGPLDQGFWPDGLNTPPTEEAMVYDLEVTKQMGFNMLRKHVKVEPRRFYYHTDRMGILVWQDMPSMYYNVFELPEFADRHDEVKANFEAELTELIHDHFNPPSIIMWVPFNEGWGQYETGRIVDLTRSLDASRPINEASGWTDNGFGDIKDIHNYPEPAAPPAEENRAIVLGEFGGLGLVTPGHMWQEENWGYEKMQDINSLIEKYEDFYQEIFRMVENPGLSAVIYTQTTDVETETNGLMTYDRAQVKMGIEQVLKAHQGKIPPRINAKTLQFTATFEAELVSPVPEAIIRYTTDGSDPIASSPVYSQPLTFKETTTIRTVAEFPDGTSSRVASYTIKKVTPAPAVSASAKPGIRVSFYEGNWNKLPDFATLKPSRSTMTGKPDLSYARTDKHFGLVFEGYLDVPTTGVYMIYLASDDGGRIYLDENQLIDYDGIHGANERFAPVALEAGLHPFKLIYFQREGGLGLSVSWEGPGIPKSEITPAFWKN